MSSALKDSAALYCQERDELTHSFPISKIDTSIIKELTAIVKKLNPDVHKVLKQYKNVDDADILESLQKLNESIDDEGNQQKGKVKPKVPWLDFEGRMFMLPFVVSFEKDEDYDNQTDRPLFTIVMNKGPLPTAHSNYEDTVFEYRTKEHRDDAYEKLRSKLEATQHIKFM